MATRWFILVSVCGLLAGGIHAQGTDKDVEKMQGTWKVVAAERDGKKPPDDDLKAFRFTFKGDKLILKNGDKEQEATYKLDASKKPKTIDIVRKVGDKMETIPGIYQFDGDDLKLCAAGEPGKERPKEFATKAGAGVGLMLLKRDKP